MARGTVRHPRPRRCRRDRRRAAGRQQERDRDRLDPGPLRADRRLRQAGAARHDAARRRDQRAGRHQRPQAQAPGGGLRLRPEEGGAGGAEAGQPGQDLHHGRPHRHGAEPGGDAGAVREERDQLLPGHRGARDVRAVPSPEVLVRGDLLRPDAHRLAQARQGQGREEGLHDVPGRRVRPGGRARRRSRAEDDRHGPRREDQLQARRDRLLLAGGDA